MGDMCQQSMSTYLVQLYGNSLIMSPIKTRKDLDNKARAGSAERCRYHPNMHDMIFWYPPTSGI